MVSDGCPSPYQCEGTHSPSHFPAGLLPFHLKGHQDRQVGSGQHDGSRLREKTRRYLFPFSSFKSLPMCSFWRTVWGSRFFQSTSHRNRISTQTLPQDSRSFRIFISFRRSFSGCATAGGLQRSTSLRPQHLVSFLASTHGVQRRPRKSSTLSVARGTSAWLSCSPRFPSFPGSSTNCSSRRGHSSW